VTDVMHRAVRGARPGDLLDDRGLARPRRSADRSDRRRPPRSVASTTVN
jgi:hypothetical protein